MPWDKSKKYKHKTKYSLAIEMIETALKKGYPRCIVLADSRFGIELFIKELKRLDLPYVVK